MNKQDRMIASCSSNGERRGFTLVEMLISMAVTLLMMAALARAFAFVGDKVRDGRGTVELSNQLRDITTRLKDELNRCTVSLTPSSGAVEPPGYFLYYEGPMTNATSSIFPPSGTVDGNSVAPLSRYGDLDDYLAFTAVSKPGTWFTGKVPQFVLTGVATDTEPVVIRSKYAEIVYFTNPDRDPATGDIVDADTDDLPDRVSLYRRVLLIRPDLNLTVGGSVHNLVAGANWQTGMADVYQLSDLSVRRGINANGVANNSIIANSLSDLSKPHNRFGHVRPPADLVGLATTQTTMPILALEEPVALISSASSTTPSLRPVDASTSTKNIVLEDRWSGFLRREYLLTGDRQGEDLVVNNCRALDLQIMDPLATFALATGNVVVGPSDVGYREALLDTHVALNGGFVDLAYPFLAGGPTRGFEAMRVAESDTTGTALTTLPVATFQTPFSGLDPTIATLPTSTGAKTYTDALMMSGRVVTVGGQVRLFQPAFDTFTANYERDGFPQLRRYTVGTDRFYGTVWDTPATLPTTGIDFATDGLDNNDNVDPGADDPRERETSAPFTATPSAIRVSIRLENPSVRLIRQMSVVHTDGR